MTFARIPVQTLYHLTPFPGSLARSVASLSLSLQGTGRRETLRTSYKVRWELGQL